MAVFDEVRITKDMDLPKLKKRFYKLSEDLKYMFSNLDEDNYSKEFIDHLEEREGKLREFSFNADGLKIRFENFDKDITTSLEADNKKIDMLVARGDVVETLMSRLTLYGEKIVISGNRMVIKAENITLDENGNVTFSGKISGGSINIKDRFIVDQEGNAYMDGSLDVGLLNPRKSVACGELEADSDEGYGHSIDGTVTVMDEVYVGEDLSCNRVRYNSDRRLKEETGEALPADEIIGGLRPVSYVMGGRKRIGFIAQDVYRLRESLGRDIPLVSRHGRYLDLPLISYGAVFAAAIKRNQERLDRIRERIEERRGADGGL